MGLLKTAAKAAVASSVHGRIQRRQQQRWAAQDQAQATAATPRQAPAVAPGQPPVAAAAPTQQADMDDRLAQLTQLGELLRAGVLTEAEFQQQKAQILSG